MLYLTGFSPAPLAADHYCTVEQAQANHQVKLMLVHLRQHLHYHELVDVGVQDSPRLLPDFHRPFPTNSLERISEPALPQMKSMRAVLSQSTQAAGI
jgi:hypothetical protein